MSSVHGLPEIENFSFTSPRFNYRIVVQMFLFLLSCAGLAGDTNYDICFYNNDVKECDNKGDQDRRFKVSDFASYKEFESTIQDVGVVKYYLACNLPADAIVNLAALNGATSVAFHSVQEADRFTLNLEGECTFPTEIHGLTVNADVKSFGNLTLDRCDMSECDLVVGDLTSDLESIGSLKSVQQFSTCEVTMSNFPPKEQTVVINGNGQLKLLGEVTTPVKLDLVNSNLVVKGGNTTDCVAFDTKLYSGTDILIDNGWSMLSMIRCLSYSKLTPIPKLRIRHSGFLEIPASNWPIDMGTLLTIERTGPMLLHVGGIVPLDILRAPYQLQIITSLHDVTIMGKIEVDDNCSFKLDTLTYLVPSKLQIGELDGRGVVNVSGWPPIFTITIEKFSQESDNVEYNFGGDALYSFHGVPPKGCVVNVVNMWADANLSLPIDLTSANVFNIGNKLKIPQVPLVFTPYWYDESKLPSEEEIQQKKGTKIPFVCGDLLNCSREAVEWPAYGPRGFTSGAAVYEPYCERVNGVNCSGIQLVNDITKLYKKFCIAQSEDQCSKDAKFTDNWKTFIQTNARDVAFEIFKPASLDFSEFNNIEVTITGTNNNKVSVNVTNVKKLISSGASLSVTGSNNATEFFFTNTVIADQSFNWSESNVTCDMATWKSLGVAARHVTITDAAPAKVTVGESQVSLDDQIVKGAFITLNVTSETLEIVGDGTIDIFFLAESAVVTVGSGCNGVRLHNLNGTLKSKAGESPITMIDPRSVVFESDGEVSFTSDEFEVSGNTLFKNPVQFKNLVFKGDVQTSGSKLTATSVSAQGVLSTPIESLQVNEELSISPNSRLLVNDVKLSQGAKIVVNYELNGLPFMQLNSNSPITSPEIELVYVNTYFSDVVRENVAASVFEYGNVSLICGDKFQCDEDMVSFRSEIINFNDTYSMLLAKCSNNCLMLVANTSSLIPPTASPVPPLPTATDVPDHTKRNVIIITVTAMIGFFVIVAIVIRLMNKKQSYEKEKKKKKLEQEQYQSLNDPGMEDPEPARFTT